LSSFSLKKIINTLILLVKINGAEGVVSEPLLPSGDQGRKVGFAIPIESAPSLFTICRYAIND
jgi:hypothetical protein